MKYISNLCSKSIDSLKKINYVFLIVSVVHFIITFFTDKLMINFKEYNLCNYIVCKIILFVIIVIFWQFISRALSNKNTEIRRYFKYFLIYFIPMGILLVLIWPGVWYGSDVYNFIACVEGNYFLYYLNYLTSIFYSIGCMLFPCPSGVIILQTICFGIVASYIVKRTFDVSGEKKISYAMYIPFLLFNTLFYTFYPNRPVMVGIFYLLLVSILVFDRIDKTELTKSKIFTLAFLTGILATWRTENMYLIGAVPLFIFLGYKIKCNIKNLLRIIVPILIATIVIYIPQYMNSGTEKDKAIRNLPIYVNPLSCMINESLKGEKIDEAIKKIDKVLNIEILKENPSYSDTPTLWNPDATRNFTLKEFEEFKEGYNYIIKNNLGLYIKNRVLTFSLCSGVFNDSFTSKDLYTSNDDMISDYKSSKPIFDYRIRKGIVSMLEGRWGTNGVSILPYRIVFNLLLPLFFTAIIFIYSIIKRNLYDFLMTGMILGHTTLVFITAPAGYFMYYFNVYITAWSMFILYVILKFIKRLDFRRKNDKKNR